MPSLEGAAALFLGGFVGSTCLLARRLRSARRELRDREDAWRRLQVRQRELATALRLDTAGEVATCLSYELNQPLAAIGGHLEAHRRALRAAGDHHPALDDVAAALTQVDRASRIVRRLRAAAEPRALRRVGVDLHALLAETFELLAPELAERGVRWTLALAPSAPRVEGDPAQLRRVLSRLASSVASSVPPHADWGLLVRTGTDDPRTAEVEIRDSRSCAPAPEFDPRFDPRFDPDDQASLAALQGAGVAMSQRTIELHGGRLWARHVDDRGLAFRLVLPRAGFRAAGGPRNGPEREGRHHAA